MDRGKCRSCGKPIYWVRTSAGKVMPVEVDVRSVVTAAGDVINGHESHFAYCPNAAQHRRKG